MLRILIVTIVFVLIAVSRSETASTVRRLTITPEQSLNLNPSLSDDGRTLVFESSADVFGDGGGGPSFHGIRADLPDGSFMELVRGRMVSPALSSDGRVVAFASREDLVGKNPDRNSEIFVFEGPVLRQLTNTVNGGNVQPSITSDGQSIVFNSNGETPKISGDGSRVYFKTADSDLYVVEKATGKKTLIASAVPELFVSEGRAVSNDGMRFVYAAAVAPNQTQVFLYDARDNRIRQLTQLGSRVTDVKLQPTISGDGKRVAFATRRRVTATSDGSVELYVLDLPTGQVQQVTNAPSRATAEVVASLNFDGSLVAFNFPRVLSGELLNEDFENNSEIYVASLTARPAFGDGTLLNAALGHEAGGETRLAPGSIASFRGSALGSIVSVNGHAAKVIHASPNEVVFVVPEAVPLGPAEIIVTNMDGFASKAEAIIASAAPGIFTVAGDGRGAGIILDSDSLTPAPFDPSNRQRRLSIFATGVRHATSVSVTINGVPAAVETVAANGFSGLDEIHVLLPASLSGAGTATLSINADGVTGNPVSVLIAGAPPVSPDKVVINQVFGGGGNSGAPFRNDFIEIFNAGSTPVNLAGWSVQYASATASTWSVTPLTAISLATGQRYLIQQGGGNNGVALPTPDAIGTIAMAAGAGKVALVKNTNALTGACPTGANIVDFLGYGGTANCFRGTGPAPTASNTNAALRGANGCTDTSNNASDFTLAPPNPRNTSAPFSPCGITIARSSEQEIQSTCSARSETLRLAHALAQRRNNNSTPTLRLRRFP